MAHNELSDLGDALTGLPQLQVRACAFPSQLSLLPVAFTTLSFNVWPTNFRAKRSFFISSSSPCDISPGLQAGSCTCHSDTGSDVWGVNDLGILKRCRPG